MKSWYIWLIVKDKLIFLKLENKPLFQKLSYLNSNPNNYKFIIFYVIF